MLLDPVTGRPAERDVLLERAGDDRRFAQVVDDLRRAHFHPDLLGSDDGRYFRDSKPPFALGDLPTITLLTTSLQLWPTAFYTGTPLNYFTPGKKMKLTVFGKFTTAATPGNLTIEIRYGTTDAGGVILATSIAVALTAAKTNISWTLDAYIECRAIGSGTSGSLFAWGRFIPDQASLLIPAANNPMLIPASAAVAAGVDTTTAQGINIQMKRSGSTVETVTVQDVNMEALN